MKMRNSVRGLGFLVILSVGLSSSAKAQLTGESLAGAQAGQQDLTRWVSAWNAERTVAGSDQCSDADEGSAVTALQTVAIYAQTARSRWQKNTIQYVDQILQEEANSTSSIAAEATDSLADAELSHHCLDKADFMYRVVIKDYPGSEFASYRERAELGVQDVRDKRAAKP